MKNITTIVQVILAVAVIGLYGLYFGNKQGDKNLTSNTQVQNGNLRIAYIKLDSLLINYNFAQELHKDFAEKQEAYNKEFGTKRMNFEKEAASFQEKLQRGGFTNQQRAIQERDRLAGIEQEIQKMDYELSSKLSEMQAKNNQQIVDTISNYLDVYNEDAKYSFIINANGVLKGDEVNNVTADVLQKLNDRYKKMK